ncbi:alpha/beta fold hydrolase [Arcticibacterium luteifluviistationis]|uniref:Alpha/beta hydrolase n=1 Tax=Arcticibacterium luteifluviistationis TaxID=1784714 RepID=A0A2Z4GHM6_9BACT|nr:alpha/beta fold hydrolase [Arcticibacterium luteifluviistationis]AWW00682.1 alpha/beta hydrolase [Arcticibacterium luteifluviistationis]
MKLFFRKVGEGKPLIILHGFLGSSDNLFTISKQLAAAGFAVYLLDARNHGQSPSSSEHNYTLMAEDLAEFIKDENIVNPVILGHSMGGKTVLQYAQKYDNYEKLVIVDIAPKFYPTHHDKIIAGLNAIPINSLKSRKEAETIFSEYVSDPGERMFILKNIYRTDEGFAWRINIPTLSKELENIGEEIVSTKQIDKPVLFLKGSESDYIKEGDFDVIKETYVNAELIEIEGANHWVHATKPKEFVEAVSNFAL